MSEKHGSAAEMTFVSEWDLSTKQYRAVVQGSGDQKVIVASQAGDGPVIGIVQNKPESGQAARVAMFGPTKMTAGAAITRGAVLRATATGFVTTGNSGYTVGIALESANSGSAFMGIVTAAAQATA